jgi:hypothetical protein
MELDSLAEGSERAGRQSDRIRIAVDAEETHPRPPLQQRPCVSPRADGGVHEEAAALRREQLNHFIE